MGFLLASLLLLPSFAVAQSSDLAVRYRSTDTVYLNAGRLAGLAVGDRFEVLHGAKTVAEIEVVYVADHSASCRIVTESEPIKQDDRVRRVGGAPTPPVEDAGIDGEAAAAGGAAATPATTVPEPTYLQTRRRPPTRLSGALVFEWESFTDDSGADLDFNRTQLRLNLRVRDIGGLPLEFRARTRLQQNKRARPLSPTISESESRNRLYDVSLVYNPPEGRFYVQAGRIGTSPFTGVGYMDGFLGQVRLSSKFAIGGFFGANAQEREFGFESDSRKYGAFTRFTALPQGSGSALEMYLAAVREDFDQEVSREYVALETSYTPAGSWSFHQRLEVDVNRDWREELSDSTSQLSNFSLAATTRLSAKSRFSLSFNRFERYRTAETRFIPEELFDDLPRDGVRANYQWRSAGGLGFFVNAGYRFRESDNEQNTFTFGGGVRHSRVSAWGLSLGANVNGYSNPYTEGLIAAGRVGKSLRGGHQVGLTVGGRFSQSVLFDDEEDRTDGWLRLDGWFELPKGLFATVELELDAGDDLEGKRILLGLGYRL
ncbi:MAG: hypothetical protein WBH85_15655 [Thermoanaerobaculia bacterium]